MAHNRNGIETRFDQQTVDAVSGGLEAMSAMHFLLKRRFPSEAAEFEAAIARADLAWDAMLDGKNLPEPALEAAQ